MLNKNYDLKDIFNDINDLSKKYNLDGSDYHKANNIQKLIDDNQFVTSQQKAYLTFYNIATKNKKNNIPDLKEAFLYFTSEDCPVEFYNAKYNRKKEILTVDYKLKENGCIQRQKTDQRGFISRGHYDGYDFENNRPINLKAAEVNRGRFLVKFERDNNGVRKITHLTENKNNSVLNFLQNKMSQLNKKIQTGFYFGFKK